MERMFPHALVACIAEGRSPQLTEFEDLAATVLREAFAGLSTGCARKLANIVADVAFHGRRTVR